MAHSNIVICSKKHDQQLHRRWEENDVLYCDEHVIIGMNKETVVEEANGKRWVTEEPAFFYFHRDVWFNIIYLHSNEPYYYCNLASPFTYENGIISYVDYDIDIVVKMDGSFQILDVDEFEEAKKRYGYSDTVIHNVKKHVDVLLDWIRQEKGPFHPSYKKCWMNYLEKEV